MSYQEFVEALAAICLFRFPDPFTPLSVKLDTFLTTQFIKPLKQLQQQNVGGRQARELAEIDQQQLDNENPVEDDFDSFLS